MPNQGYLTEKDWEEIEQRLQEVFMTKEEFTQYRSDLMNKLDEILKEIITSREEQTIIGGQTSDHEDRIATLEKTISA